MSQEEKAALLEEAEAEIATWLKSRMDFSQAKEEQYEQMELIAYLAGIAPEDGREVIDEKFPDFRRQLVAWAAQKAEIEISQAVSAAEAEQAAHMKRLVEFGQEHDQLLKALDLIEPDRMPDPAEGEQSAASIDSFRAETKKRAEDFHRDFMALIQQKHRINVEYCFTSHLVSKETARKLANLYEVWA